MFLSHFQLCALFLLHSVLYFWGRIRAVYGFAVTSIEVSVPAEIGLIKSSPTLPTWHADAKLTDDRYWMMILMIKDKETKKTKHL